MSATTLTKDERWEIRRLAKRVRGLYTAEQQALNFVAEAQTMAHGVCSQSLTRHAADYGYVVRNIQRGLHGKHRDGKLEYPGLLVRGIVYVAGGYPKGGRAPGGAGLTPAYAINLEEMMKFIPEMDDDNPEPPKKDETLGETKGDTLGDTYEKKGDTLGDLMTYKFSSSSVFTSQRNFFANASDTPIFPPAAPDPPACATTVARAGTSDPEATDASATVQHTQRCFSKQAVQTAPPMAVTCEAGVPSASGLEKQQGVQLQAAVSRIAKAKLGNHRYIPKNLAGKFELLVIAHGVAVVSQDFANWCDEDTAAKKKMTYPIHEYVKVVDARFGQTQAEDSQAVGDVEELIALSYSLTDTLTTTKQKNQIAKVLKEFPVATIKTALAYYVEHLREEPTSATMSLFWKVENIYAVLKSEHKRCEATEGDEDLRKVKPMQHDLQAIKRNVGTLPFTKRLRLNSNGYSSCPFHQCKSEKNFHVERLDDGVAIGTCFSACAKSFDAIAFVEKFDKVSTGESIRTLSALVGDIENGNAFAGLPPKPKQSPMTLERWTQSGRAITDADVAKLSASRPNSATPSAATLNRIGFKMGEIYGRVFIIAPYRIGDTFYTLKARNIAAKEFIQENNVSQQGLFNIEAVTAGCDVYVVESELDAAVLHEHGFTAVSVVNAKQRQIEPEVLARLLTAQRIFLIGDNDAAGTTCMDALAKILPAEKVNRLSVPDGAKDVGEWAMKDQFQEQFEANTCAHVPA